MVFKHSITRSIWLGVCAGRIGRVKANIKISKTRLYALEEPPIKTNTSVMSYVIWLVLDGNVRN